MPASRIAQGLPGLLLHLGLAFALVPGWLLMRPGPSRRLREQRFFARCLRAVGLELDVRGAPESGGGTLFVANHISFTDVLALAALLDAHFVAKADVADWPLIGTWARRLGTLFVDRADRRSAAAQAESLAKALASRADLVLFPEGTTSDGSSLLPFRSSLLEAARFARQVQPIALTYSDGARRGYVGNESLVANLVRLAPHRATLRVDFLPPLETAQLSDRKDLALLLQERISAARTPAQSGSRIYCDGDPTGKG
jgi:1-acyl-sn-glycerol-3-phosphate acyltransferase